MLTVCANFVHQPFGNHFGKQPKKWYAIHICVYLLWLCLPKKHQLGSLEPSTLNMSDAEELKAGRIFELEHLEAIPSNVFIYMIFFFNEFLHHLQYLTFIQVGMPPPIKGPKTLTRKKVEA